MIIPGGAKIPGTSGLARGYKTQTYSAPQAARGEFARRFDSVTISGAGADAGGSYALELKGRLTQEVRTATSSDMVAALREQVQNGAYQPDPREIARKMLLMEDI